MNARCKVGPEGLVQDEAAAGGNVERESTEHDAPGGVGAVVDLKNLVRSYDHAARVGHVGAQGDRDDRPLRLTADSGGRLAG